MRSWVPVVLLGLAGCGSVEVETDYSLQLIPNVPLNQNPFEDGPVVKIAIRDELGFGDVFSLGALETGSITGDQMPVLRNAYLGVILEESGGKRNTYEPELLVAYGEAGPFDLDLGKEDVQEEFLLPEFAGVGDLGGIGGDPIFGAAVAVTEAGNVYFFGGAEQATGNSFPTDEIKRVRLDDGQWQAQTLSHKLYDRLALATATVVRADDDKELILVAGGRAELDDWGPNTNQLALYDADTAELLWSGTSGLSRSDQAVVVMNNGRVVMIGGFTGDGMSMPFSNVCEYFDIAGSGGNYRVTSSYCSGEPSHKRMGNAGAAVEGRGAVFCGGAFAPDASADYQSPTAACDRVDLQGQVTPFTALPQALGAHAMAQLADGRLLVTGGISQDLPQISDGPAIASAWVIDPENPGGGWTQVGDMVNARAHHAILPTADGRAIIVGGSSETGWDRPNSLGERVRCPEIFDPETDTFSAAGSCSDAGTGTYPAFGYHPNHGAVFLDGYDRELRGGKVYGIVGMGPEF